jgi:hypothetical protein
VGSRGRARQPRREGAGGRRGRRRVAYSHYQRRARGAKAGPSGYAVAGRCSTRPSLSEASGAWRPLAVRPLHFAIGRQPPPGHGGRRLPAGCGATPGNRWDFLRSVAAAPLEPCWARVNGLGKGVSDPVQHDLCLTGWRVMRASCDARIMRCAHASRDREMVPVNVRSGDF